MNRTYTFRGRWARGNRQWYYGTSEHSEVDYRANIIPMSIFWADVEKGLIDAGTVGEFPPLHAEEVSRISEEIL